jgi:hypothetical protein
MLSNLVVIPFALSKKRKVLSVDQASPASKAVPLKKIAKSLRNEFYSAPLVRRRIEKVKRTSGLLPPFMITSSGSAGSHLLGILLDSHPQIAVGPEVYLLNKREIYGDYAVFQENLAQWLSTGLTTAGPEQDKRFVFDTEKYGWDRRLLPILAQRTSSICEFLDVFFGYFLLLRKKQMWGEKLPGNVNCISEFLAAYPEGKIIHLVRDGRDVAASFAKRHIPLAKAAEIWLYANTVALQWQDDPRFLLVRYEDLVNIPDETLQTIQKHLGVPCEDLVTLRAKNAYWHQIIRSENENIHQSWQHNPLLSPISASAVGSYHKKLTEGEMAAFCQFSIHDSEFSFPPHCAQTVGKLMKELDYL